MDPYSTLNVPRDATREEVRGAFVRVARSTHPDKARPQRRQGGDGSAGSASQQQQAANDVFSEVDEAWKILGDDQMRDAYDSFGLAGTEALSTLRVQAKGAAISKKQLQRRVDVTRQILEDQEFQSRSTIRCHVSLQDIVNFCFGKWEKTNTANNRIPSFSHILAEHSTQFEMGPKDLLSVNVVAGSAKRKKTPQGGFIDRPTLGSLTLTHSMMRGLNNFEYSFTVSSIRDTSPRFHVKGTRVLAKGLTGEIGFNAETESAGINVSLAKYIGPQTIGHIVLGFGNEDGVAVGLRHEMTVKRFQQDSSATTDASDQPPPSSSASQQQQQQHLVNRLFQSNLQIRAMEGLVFAFTWSEPVTLKSRLKSNVHLSLANAVFEIESTRILTERSKFAGSISIGLRNGVTLKLKLLRGGNRYELPIMISPKVTLASTLLTGIVPIAIQYLVGRVLRPYRRGQRVKMRQLLREEAQKSRVRARNQMMLMKAASDQNRTSEMKADGLVVQLARFGRNLDEDYEWVDPELRPNIDVTIQLNFFVSPTNSSLDLKEGSKVGLLGFYDPSVQSTSRSQVWPEDEDDDEDDEQLKTTQQGDKNKLFIRYLFRGVQYEILLHNEEAQIHLPHPDAERVV